MTVPADKKTALAPKPAPTAPPAPLAGEPALDVFADFLAASTPPAALIALIGEVSTMEAEAARLTARFPEAKAERRQAALDAENSDAAALAHARLVAEIEAAPGRIGRAEASRVNACLRFLEALRRHAKEVVLSAQEAMLPAQEAAKEAAKQINQSDSGIAYGSTVSDAERAGEQKKLNDLGKQLAPLQDAERLAEQVYTVAAARAERYGAGILPEYQDRLILLSDYGRGVCVEAAGKAAEGRALKLVQS